MRKSPIHKCNEISTGPSGKLTGTGPRARGQGKEGYEGNSNVAKTDP